MIDEISMLDSELFGVLDHIGRQARNSATAFGGIQVPTTLLHSSPPHLTFKAY